MSCRGCAMQSPKLRTEGFSDEASLVHSCRARVHSICVCREPGAPYSSDPTGGHEPFASTTISAPNWSRYRGRLPSTPRADSLSVLEATCQRQSPGLVLLSALSPHARLLACSTFEPQLSRDGDRRGGGQAVGFTPRRPWCFTHSSRSRLGSRR